MMRWIIALIVVALIGSAAHADRKKAESLFRSGERAYRAQNFRAAAQYFVLSYKELPAPELAFSAAQAFRRAYRVEPANTQFVDESIKYYELYLKERKTGGRVGDAADSLGEMLRERARLGNSGKGGAGDLEKSTLLGISVALADQQQAATKMEEVAEGKDAMADMKVKLLIDGKQRDLDTLHPVEAGDHTVRVEAPGYEPLEKRVRVIAGAQHSEEIVLQPKPAQVTVTSEAGATVIVNGRGAGQAPVTVPLPAGSHVITVLRAGRRPEAREVVVTRDQKLTVPIALESTTRRRSVKWVGIAAGGAVVMTAFFGLGAWYGDNQATDKLLLLQQDMGNQPQSTLDDYNSARTLRDRSVTGMWITSGVAVTLGVTAAWLYYFDTPSADGVTVVPLAGPEGAGAAIAGRF